MVYDHLICRKLSHCKESPYCFCLPTHNPAMFVERPKELLNCNRLSRSRRCSTTADLVNSVVFVLLRLRNRVHSVRQFYFKLPARMTRAINRSSLFSPSPSQTKFNAGLAQMKGMRGSVHVNRIEERRGISTDILRILRCAFYFDKNRAGLEA
jgi:hypothetical protein